MVHYLNTNEEVLELSQKHGLLLPTIKIGDTIRLKDNWLNIFIDMMQANYFSDIRDRSSSILHPAEETVEYFKGGDTCIITNKFIAIDMGGGKSIWWSGTYRTHGEHSPDYLFDECFEPIVTNMYAPRKFVYESFNEFNKQIK